MNNLGRIKNNTKLFSFKSFCIIQPFRIKGNSFFYSTKSHLINKFNDSSFIYFCFICYSHFLLKKK